ncbi:MAG: ComEC/Rec2 family competence protein [Planctomycetota bacterium]
MLEAPLVAPRYRPLLPVALAAAAGVLADRYGAASGFSPADWLVASSTALSAYLAFSAAGRHRSAAACLLAAVASLFGAWHLDQQAYAPRNGIGLYASEASEAACVEGVVHGPVRWSPSPPREPMRALPTGPGSTFEMKAERIRHRDAWRPVQGRIRARVEGHLAEVHSGDRVVVTGRLTRAENQANPGGFDWSRFARTRGYDAQLFSSATELVNVDRPATSGAPAAALGAIHRWCVASLMRHVGPQHGDLSTAILLGTRERIDREQVEAFLHTGTIHLLVVSGLHIGVLAWFVNGALGLVLKDQRVIAIALLLFVAGYVALTGARPPVLRAAALISAVVVANAGGRRVSGLNTLSLAALLILTVSPMELFQGGTQLSFVSVASLAALARLQQSIPPAPPIEEVVRDYEPAWKTWLRTLTSRLLQLLAASCTIWLVAAPLVAHHFHIISFTGLLLSPLLGTLVCFELMASGVICLVSWPVPMLASLLGALCDLVLTVVRGAVEFAAGWGAHAYTPGPDAWWVCGYYAGLVFLAVVPALRLRWRWAAAAAVLWASAGLVASRPAPADDELHCTFIAVGHGTCVLLEMPGGQTLLYDAGSLNSPDAAADDIARVLWHRRITRLDAVVLSHADVDHYNAVPGLATRVQIDAVYVSPLMFDPWATGGAMTAPNRLRAVLDRHGIPLHEVWVNDRLRFADLRVAVEVLHPPRAGVRGRDNANSVVLSIEFLGKKILLPGDLEDAGIDALRADQSIDCDVLLAPHHGSLASDPPGFAQWCRPEWVVISGRRPRNLAEAALLREAYGANGAAVLHTAEAGAIRFSVAGEGIRTTTYLGQGPLE